MKKKLCVQHCLLCTRDNHALLVCSLAPSCCPCWYRKEVQLQPEVHGDKTKGWRHPGAPARSSSAKQSSAPGLFAQQVLCTAYSGCTLLSSPNAASIQRKRLQGNNIGIMNWELERKNKSQGIILCCRSGNRSVKALIVSITKCQQCSTEHKAAFKPGGKQGYKKGLYWYKSLIAEAGSAFCPSTAQSCCTMGYSSAGEVRAKYGEKVTAVCKERSAEMVQPASRDRSSGK